MLDSRVGWKSFELLFFYLMFYLLFKQFVRTMVVSSKRLTARVLLSVKIPWRIRKRQVKYLFKTLLQEMVCKSYLL
jgi:hypothetical protein